MGEIILIFMTLILFVLLYLAGKKNNTEILSTICILMFSFALLIRWFWLV